MTAKCASAGPVAGATQLKTFWKYNLPKSVAHTISFRTILKEAIKRYMRAEIPASTSLLKKYSSDPRAWMKSGALELHWAIRLRESPNDVMSIRFPLVAIFRSSSAEAERAF
jgi:hypothetical protein